MSYHVLIKPRHARLPCVLTIFKMIPALARWSVLMHFTQCLSEEVPFSTRSFNSQATKREYRGSESSIQYCGNLDVPAISTTGDKEEGPGFWITNHDDSPEANYFLYENSRDEHPWKSLSLSAGSTAFVSVCNTWQGRVVRGTAEVNLDGKVHNLGTWFKSSVAPNGWIWGDISFLEGCDGGGSVAATDGSNITRGCYEDVLTSAPESAISIKETGTKVLAKLVGDTPNRAAMDWELSKCNSSEVWIDEGISEPVIKSINGRLEFVFYKGRA